MSDATSIKVDILTIDDNKRIGYRSIGKGRGTGNQKIIRRPDFEQMTVTELNYRLRAIIAERLPSKKSLFLS